MYVQTLRVLGRFRPLRSPTMRKNGTEQTVQKIRCKPSICKCQERWACPIQEKNPNASCTYVRTYVHIPQVLVRYLFSHFDTGMLHVRKGKHSTAEQHRRNNENENENFRKKKKSPFPLMPDWNTLHRSKILKKNRATELLSQPRTPPAPLGTTSPSIQSG